MGHSPPPFRTTARKLLTEKLTRQSRSKPRLKPKRSASLSPARSGLSRRLYDPSIQNLKREKKQSRPSTGGAIVPPAPTPAVALSSSIETSRVAAGSFPDHGTPSLPAHVILISEKKSLQLRLQGQLQSIRVLETQLTEATQIITAKDQQLHEVMKRLNAVEQREKKRLRRELEERQQNSGGNERLRLEERKVLQLQVTIFPLVSADSPLSTLSTE
jgi:hypothetical protein